MKVNKIQMFRAIKICKEFNAEISFKFSNEYSEVCILSRQITIDLCEVQNLEDFWSLIFHELGHIWCYDNNKYINYHTDCNGSKAKTTKYIRKMGLRAEKYVDKIGEQLMCKYKPNLNYKPAYATIDDIQWYKAWINITYPLRSN